MFQGSRQTEKCSLSVSLFIHVTQKVSPTIVFCLQTTRFTFSQLVFKGLRLLSGSMPHENAETIQVHSKLSNLFSHDWFISCNWLSGNKTESGRIPFGQRLHSFVFKRSWDVSDVRMTIPLTSKEVLHKRVKHCRHMVRPAPCLSFGLPGHSALLVLYVSVCY